MYNKYNNKYHMYPNYGDKENTVLSCFCLLDDKYDELYLEDVIKKGIKCRKYYKPLINSKIAYEFYNRILCYPLNIDINEILLD